MKTLTLFFVAALAVWAQNPPATGLQPVSSSVAGGTCTNSQPAFYSSADQKLYTCFAGVWTAVSGGGSPSVGTTLQQGTGTGGFQSSGIAPSAVVRNDVTGTQTINSQLNAPNVNNGPSVDGTSTTNATWQGAWSSSAAYQTCNAVSYSGANYIATAPSTNVTPGTAVTSWQSVFNTSASFTPTQLDCAFYTSLGNAATNLKTTNIKLNQAGIYNTCAGLNGGNSGSYGVGLIGAGYQMNVSSAVGIPIPLTGIEASCNLGTNPIYYHGPVPTGGIFQLGGLYVKDIGFNALGNAAQCYEIDGAFAPILDLLTCTNATSTDHWAGIGTANVTGFTGFNNNVRANWLYTVANSTPSSSWANVTPPAGGNGSWTITSGGSYRNTNAAAVLLGFATGSAQPCTTMGTTTVTFTGTAVTAITGSGYSGCAATLYGQVPDIFQGAKAFHIQSTDSTFQDISTGGIGTTAAIYIAGGANHFIHLHPNNAIVGVYNSGQANSFDGTEIDSVSKFLIDDEGAGAYTGTKYVNNGSYAGSSGIYLGNSNGANFIGMLCGESQSLGGYYPFVTSGGVISATSSTTWTGLFPSTIVVSGVQVCDGTFHVMNYLGGTLVTNGLQMLTDGDYIDLGSNQRAFVGSTGGNLNLQTTGAHNVVFGVNSFSLGSGTLAGYASGGLPFSVEATIASATTIAPASPIVFVTGTTPIATMTAPTNCTTSGTDCEVELIADPATGPYTMTTAGNIYAAFTATIGVGQKFRYRPASSKWYAIN